MQWMECKPHVENNTQELRNMCITGVKSFRKVKKRNTKHKIQTIYGCTNVSMEFRSVNKIVHMYQYGTRIRHNSIISKHEKLLKHNVQTHLTEAHSGGAKIIKFMRTCIVTHWFSLRNATQLIIEFFWYLFSFK